MLAVWVGLMSRIAALHLGTEAPTREKIVQRSRIRLRLYAERGRIYAGEHPRHMLAVSTPTRDVCADPAVIVSNGVVEQVAATLASRLDLPLLALLARLARPERRFEYVQRFVAEEKALAISELSLPGIFLQESSLRQYPNGSFLCHVLGFTLHDGTGGAGVEQLADPYLRGSPGVIEGSKNAFRQEMYEHRCLHVAPVRGADVILTIHPVLQHEVERVLEATQQEHRARGAWAVVQRIRTGEILALASRPAYDPAAFHRADPDAVLNRAIGYVYEPGSTLKVAAIAAALNEGLTQPDEIFHCEQGSWYCRGRILRDSHPYGELTLADGVKKSSNILTAKVALRLGEERLYQYLNAFGFGRRTGIDLPGEESGILHPVERWSPLSLTRIPIGQGVAVTAVQMLNFFCAIANDGVLMRPFVIRRIEAADGTVLFENRPRVLGRPIRPETAALMRRLLVRVTERGGTGTRAAIEGFEVAGKTGTAQKPIPGGYSTTDYVASFVGFLPAEAPEMGIIVVVDEPQPLHTGGVVAAPAFARIAEVSVRCLDLQSPSRQLAGRTR